jgi:hypothetical protein
LSVSIAAIFAVIRRLFKGAHDAIEIGRRSTLSSAKRAELYSVLATGSDLTSYLPTRFVPHN